MESINALIEGINSFEGGVITVTHDARLIQETDSVLWVVGDNDVVEFEEGFDAYRDAILEELEEQSRQAERRLEAKQAKALEKRALLEKARLERLSKKA